MREDGEGRRREARGKREEGGRREEGREEGGGRREGGRVSLFGSFVCHF